MYCVLLPLLITVERIVGGGAVVWTLPLTLFVVVGGPIVLDTFILFCWVELRVLLLIVRCCYCSFCSCVPLFLFILILLGNLFVLFCSLFVVLSCCLCLIVSFYEFLTLLFIPMCILILLFTFILFVLISNWVQFCYYCPFVLFILVHRVLSLFVVHSLLLFHCS